jgi:hypothetical protein
MKRLIAILALAALLVIAGCAKQPPIGPVGSTHLHADYKVYIDNKPISFVKREYMVAAPHVHIEGMDGDVIHVHATGVTIGEYFRTLGMKFSNSCFILDKPLDGVKKFCNEEGKTLKFYVNGEPNDLYGDYLISDKDKLLISYGPADEDIKHQLAAITDKARIESTPKPRDH